MESNKKLPSIDDWDPMVTASQSFMNTMSFRINDPGSAQMGRSTGDIKNEDIPCPFQKIPGERCFKGLSCPYKHGKYTPNMLKEHPKLAASAVDQKKSVMLAMNLPKKRIPADGFVTHAYVTTAIDPSEFYLLPKDDWNCLCQFCPSEDSHSESNGDKSTYPCGFDTLDQMWTTMQNYYSVPREQTNQYIAGELVAVRLELSTGKGWFRAVVLEDAWEDEESDKAPDVNLKLLDFGLDVRKSTIDIAHLPRNFIYIAPMAYKCQLFGISPLLGKWGKKATNFFKELICGQIIIVEVKQTVHPDVDGIFNIFEKSPILLNLYVKYNGKFINVGKEMGDLGLGIEWNPYPKRPSANQVLPQWENEFAVQEVKTEDEQKSLNDVFKNVIEREKSRLHRYVERLKCLNGLQ